MSSEYLSIRQLAQYVGISHRSLEGWKREGFLPPHIEVTSKKHRWRRSDIDAWLDLKKLDLLCDYQELRDRLGMHDAWAVLVARLEGVRARTAAVVAKEVQP